MKTKNITRKQIIFIIIVSLVKWLVQVEILVFLYFVLAFCRCIVDNVIIPVVEIVVYALNEDQNMQNNFEKLDELYTMMYDFFDFVVYIAFIVLCHIFTEKQPQNTEA